jgi:hypothetical protein
MNLTASLLYPQIVHMKFDSQYFLASTFMRVQEFYESPYDNIRGQAFSLLDFMNTEARHRGTFEYFDRWIAFNFPDTALKSFLKKQKVLYLENELLKFIYIKCLVDWEKPFVVIGTSKNCDMNHELAHAFYYMSKYYKKKIENLIFQIDPVIVLKLMKQLYDLGGYCADVLKDELQAYLIEGAFSLDIGDSLSQKFIETFQEEKRKYEHQ